MGDELHHQRLAACCRERNRSRPVSECLHDRQARSRTSLRLCRSRFWNQVGDSARPHAGRSRPESRARDERVAGERLPSSVRPGRTSAATGPTIPFTLRLAGKRTRASATQGSPGSPPIIAVADDWIRPDPSAAADPLVARRRQAAHYGQDTCKDVNAVVGDEVADASGFVPHRKCEHIPTRCHRRMRLWTHRCRKPRRCSPKGSVTAGGHRRAGRRGRSARPAHEACRDLLEGIPAP